MPKERSGAEQNVTKLRQIEVLQSHGNRIPTAYKEVGLTDQSYYWYRKEYGGFLFTSQSTQFLIREFPVPLEQEIGIQTSESPSV